MENRLGNFIKETRTAKDMTLRDLAKETGISHSYLHIMETGIDPRTKRPISPTLLVLQKVAAGLDVSVEQVLCQALDKEVLLQSAGRCNRSVSDNSEMGKTPTIPPLAYEVNQDNLQRVPVLGKISAGEPRLAQENIEEWWPVDTSITRIHGKNLDQYYYLRVQGHSMEPMFNDMDLVLVRQGPVDDGQIAVVLCENEEACVKKIQYLRDQGLLLLISRNPDYPPYTRPLSECTILGRVLLRIGEPRW